MQPSSPSSRGGSRVGSVKYAHSPYVYRTTVEDAPVSPMSDQGRVDLCGVPAYRSPRSLSQSTGNLDNSLSGMQRNANGGSQHDFQSQPSSPLGYSINGQEYSQPIQVGSAPNVHPRYRRGMPSPMARAGNESGSRSGFPSSPSGSLPPRSSFTAREESTSAFSGGESAPVRVLNNPYRMTVSTGLSAPQYPMPLSGSGTQSPVPHHARQFSGNGVPASPPFGAPPTSPPNVAAGPAPAYGISNANTSNYLSSVPGSNMNSNVNHHNTSPNSNSYAPSGFAMPPTMATLNSGGSFHGSLCGRAGSQSNSYVDPRSSHPSSPLSSNNSRPPMSSSAHARGEPNSPTRAFSNGSYGGNNAKNMGHDGMAYNLHSNSKDSSSNNNGSGAHPPAFATALQQQQGGGGLAIGSFPGRRAAPPSHPSSFSSHGNDTTQTSDFCGTNTKTLSTMADDTVSSSGRSGSSASSIRDDLPLCPNDDACTAINDHKHQRKYAHTCRLFPCYHGHVVRHAKLFRHAPGQISLPEGLTAGAKVSSHALASVNFSTISPEAPNAYRIYVSHGDKSYEIFGDWASVKVHTFKRYLHQVYHIPPGSQVLSVMKTGKVMDDDINTVKCYGIEEDSVIQLRSNIEDAPAPGRLHIPLDDL